MIRSAFAAFLFIGLISSAAAMPLGSKHVIVIDEETGAVLLEKNATDIVPIASLTKLMTAMLVLDAKLPMDESIVITNDDVDMMKHTSSRVPVGAVLTRGTLLELALMSSENRAAAALARTYPGGLEQWRIAARNKAQDLRLVRTNIEEPTGLSANNTSTATDLAKMAKAAASYPEIARITTSTGEAVAMGKSTRHYRNTNPLVANKNWNILLSKTGFTNEAGRCIIMRVREAGRNAIMVLLNARGTMTRTADATNVLRLLRGEQAITVAERAPAKRLPVRHARNRKVS